MNIVIKKLRVVSKNMHSDNTAKFEHSMLRMGPIAFITGVVITILSTLFHATSEDLTNHPVLFEVYAQGGTWIAAHIGQFAGVMLIFVGGFVALFRLLVKSESRSSASALAWLGFALTIMAASTFAILQAVDGIALKRGVDSWYNTTDSATEEKAIAFKIAEGVRWVEIGINSINRIIQCAVAIIFGIAITKSALLSRWIGVFGMFAGTYYYCWRGCRVCRVCTPSRCGRHGNNNFLCLGSNPCHFYVEKNNDKEVD